jgi:hypothetical protein
MYLHSSGQLEYTHGQTQLGKSLYLYGRSKAYMQEQARLLGLAGVANKKGEPIGFEGQTWPGKINGLVAEIIGDRGATNWSAVPA